MIRITMFMSIIAITCMSTVSGYVTTDKPAPRTGRSAAEQFVLTQTSHGDVAKFGNVDDEDRTLDSDFIEALLLGELKTQKVSHEGVHIEHAIIDGRLSLAGAKLGYSTWLNDCEFKNGLDLSDTYINGTLSLERSMFDEGAGDDEGVDFVGFQVAGNVVLRKSVFKGSFNMSDAKVLGSLYAGGAQFVDQKENVAVFDGMRVGDEIELDNAIIQMSLTFKAAQAQFLSLGRNPLLDRNLLTTEDARMRIAKDLNLTQAVFRRELSIRNVEIGRFVARNLRVEGLTLLDNLEVRAEADLRHCQFTDLIVSDVTWPKWSDSTRLAGLTFQFVSPEPEDRTSLKGSSSGDARWNQLLIWMRNAAYSPETYRQLEEALKREGHPDLADETFEAMEEDARSKGDLGWMAMLKNYLLEWLVGYGRKPQIAFILSFGIILAGCVIFRHRENMEPSTKEYESRAYKPFWYSLDLFLPLIALQDARGWRPTETSRWRCIYARIHALLGWILIPIGVAAITGLISVK